MYQNYVQFMKIDKKEFQDLSNKERAEIYAHIKKHNKLYFGSKVSPRRIIHNSRFNSLLSLIGDVKNKKILDAGCGEGYFLSIIDSQEKYGVELSSKRISEALKTYPELKIKIADVNNLPFDDNTFDVIVCSEVLEHVSGYEKAIKEFKRCVKPYGHIVLSFPNEGLVRFGRLLILRFPLHEIDHINSITPSDITNILGEKYQSLNVPAIPYPFCLYQVYRFNAVDFK